MPNYMSLGCHYVGGGMSGITGRIQSREWRRFNKLSCSVCFESMLNAGTYQAYEHLIDI